MSLKDTTQSLYNIGFCLFTTLVHEPLSSLRNDLRLSAPTNTQTFLDGVFTSSVMNSANPESCYPSPSPSSHASSILRAVFNAPIQSPQRSTPSPAPVNPLAEDSANLTGDLRSPPVYHYYGLDNSTIGSSDLEDAAQPVHKYLEPLVLPRRPSINKGNLREMSESDVFGPVRRPLERARCYNERRANAELAARVKHLRTAA
ncbi:hypothetical protein B0H11DRAFT_2251711 [Mycena galericulata]|nr:hypothetical protein B0H11DRAFT_2251711 [Mycena galericulata]